MSHPYPLHDNVEAECRCCLASKPFTFRSPSDQVVCPACVHHLGSEKAARRDAEHLAMWSELFASERSAHEHSASAARASVAEKDAALLALRSQLEQLGDSIASQFERAPTGAARAMLDTEVLKRTERQTELAYRRLDRTMAALWRIDVMHHDNRARPGHCVCGRATAGCAEGMAIDGERQELRGWENRNLQLLAAGKRHGLPAEHPAVVKR